jgi:hypothetical protein
MDSNDVIGAVVAGAVAIKVTDSLIGQKKKKEKQRSIWSY